MKKALWTILTILVLGVAGAACYYYWPTIEPLVHQYLGVAEPEPEPEPEPQVINIVSKTPIPVAKPQPQIIAPQEMRKTDEMTNELVYFAGEEDQDFLSDEDEMLLGKWQNAENTQWFRVYTDEVAKDGYYWGYEWDEAEDVTEADLTKYGNGWFMWKKRGSKVMEFATADNEGQLIPRPYIITKLFYTELSYKEANSGKKRNFQKAAE